MRVLVAGGDGFCGWATALHLSAAGHDVVVLDNFIRRRRDEELGTGSLVPIACPEQRVCAWCERTRRAIPFQELDLTDGVAVRDAIARWDPEAIVDTGVGTPDLLLAIGELAPDCQLIRLDQGGVYNVLTPQTVLDARLANRYDYDRASGPVLNRFCVQAALGGPLTVEGSGEQVQGLIDVRDCARAVEQALEAPTSPGQERLLRPPTEPSSVLEVARRVQRVAVDFDRRVDIRHLERPPVPVEPPRASTGPGASTHRLSDDTVAAMLELALAHGDRIRPEALALS